MSTDTVPPVASRKVSCIFETDWTLPSIRRQVRSVAGAAGGPEGVIVGGDAEGEAAAAGDWGAGAGEGTDSAESPAPMTAVATSKGRTPSTPTTESRSPTLIVPRDCAADRSTT